jgi:hypothetical protein
LLNARPARCGGYRSCDRVSGQARSERDDARRSKLTNGVPAALATAERARHLNREANDDDSERANGNDEEEATLDRSKIGRASGWRLVRVRAHQARSGVDLAG